MSGAGVFFLILFLILLIYGIWVGYKIFIARKHGEKLSGWKSFVPFLKSPGGTTTNYPTPRSAGIVEWVKDRINGLRNKRTTVGGYEDSRGGAGHVEGQYQNLNPNSAGSSRPRGRGLEDDAWDSRVGGRDEDPYGHGPGGYYEEQELGLAPTPGIGSSQPYGTDYIGQNTSYGGGSSSRGRDDLNPFSDSHQAASLRSVSPRPDLGGIDTSGRTHRKMESDDGGNTSPISTRKSIFREDVQ